MKPALTLKLGQQLRMTPQLQQAIRLLQLSTFDLEQEIQEALDSNLMLEELDTDDQQSGDDETSLDPPGETDNSTDTSTDASADTDETGVETDSSGEEITLAANPEVDGEVIPDTSDQIASDNIADELPVDSVWEDVYEESILPTGYSGPDENDENFIDTRNSEGISIQSHLLEQVNLLHLTDTDRYIAMSVIDGLDSEGVLTIPLEDILEGAPLEFELEMDENLAVLHLIQHLDPLGIAARDLRECLLIQLKNMPKDTDWRDEAILVVDQHIKSLANRDFTHISRKTRLKESELKNVITLIQTLNPRPGNDIAVSNT